jgi:cation diffusion facilitator family transporter
MAVAIATESVGVLSEAIHSGLDMLSSLVTYFVVRQSVRPADWDHPFGHGKLENLSALLESSLLLMAAGYIFYESALKWSGNHEIYHLSLALIVTGFSAALNLFVYFQNMAVARKEESVAIETNSFHFLADVFSSLGVFLGFLLLKVTGWVFLDTLIGALVGCYVLWVGIDQLKKSLGELADASLPAEEILLIESILKKHEKEFLSYHDLRTRKGGGARYLEMHLTVCSEQNVNEAHAVCDSIENDLTKAFREIYTNIHTEPCGIHGPKCEGICRFYNRPRTKITGPTHA